MASRRPLCADISAESREPLTATASRVDHWLLVEYRGLWTPHPLTGSALSQRVKSHLASQLESLPRSRLLLIRRPDRRRQPGFRCFYGRTRERGSEFFGFELDDHEELVDVDFTAPRGERLSYPLLVVCTHGKRDRCCARYGRPLYDALCDVADERSVWQSTHVGGDRFAGNLVVLPEGLYFGRVGPADVWPVLEEYVDGRIYLDRYRGRCCYPFHVQAAERDIREATGRTRIGDLRFEGVERIGDERWRVSFRVAGSIHEVEIRVEYGDLTYLTCSAETLRRPRRYVARNYRSRRS
jgi:hypothetical protein